MKLVGREETAFYKFNKVSQPVNGGSYNVNFAQIEPNLTNHIIEPLDKSTVR